MKTDIGRLEDLVTRAVDRLKTLSSEKDELSGERQGLEARLAEATRAQAEPHAESEWESQRRMAVELIDRSLAELLGEEAPGGR